MTVTYDLIASTTLASPSSSVSFLGIPSTWRDLVLVVEILGSGGNAGCRVRLNGDSGLNYPYVLMQGDGSGTAGATGTLGLIDGYFADTTEKDLEIMQIMDYSTTNKHKPVLLKSGRPSGVIRLQAIRWASTSAVDSIEVFSSNSPYAASSTFNLFGIAS